MAVHLKNKEKTAFLTSSGIYPFKLLSFEICNPPATFDQLMELMLRGLTGVRLQISPMYLNDILVVTGRNFDAHLSNL